MSVVVDMPMPTQCASCPMWNIVPVKGEMVDLCEANQMVLLTPYGNRPTKCPIICELPKNMEETGRLMCFDPSSGTERVIYGKRDE